MCSPNVFFRLSTSLLHVHLDTRSRHSRDKQMLPTLTSIFHTVSDQKLVGLRPGNEATLNQYTQMISTHYYQSFQNTIQPPSCLLYICQERIRTGG